jgi:hypothetical protein
MRAHPSMGVFCCVIGFTRLHRPYQAGDTKAHPFEWYDMAKHISQPDDPWLPAPAKLGRQRSKTLFGSPFSLTALLAPSQRTIDMGYPPLLTRLQGLSPALQICAHKGKPKTLRVGNLFNHQKFLVAFVI